MPSPPKHSLPFRRVSTYAKFESILKGFMSGPMKLLILVGDPGLGKSKSVRSVLNGTACWIEGNATAIGIYTLLYQYRDKLIVLDDVDGIYGDANCVRLLKSLCQSEPVKDLSWNKASRHLEREGIPKTFKTSSKVVIISNDWKSLNANVKAIEDRGHVISLEPNAAEVHEKALSWFKDEEIYAWFAENLRRVKRPSFRLYIKAKELKDSGLEWKDILGETSKDFRMELMVELLNSKEYATQEDKVKAFAVKGGGSRGTFFRYKRAIEGSDEES